MESLNERAETFKNLFFGASDLVVRKLPYGFLFYFDGMCDVERLEKNVLSPLFEQNEEKIDIDTLLNQTTFSGEIKSADEDEAVQSVAAGDAVVLCAGNKTFVFSLRKSNPRSVAEPPTGTVIKGPREGFVEDLKTNMILVRRKIRSNKLVFKTVKMGRFSETQIAIAYIEGLTSKRTVDRVLNRLSDIDIDGVLDSSYLSKIIADNPYSLLKQVGNSEKADVIAARLLDGRVAVFVDGSPIVLTVPFVLIEDFEDSQDRYKMPSRVTFLRIVRLLAVFFALFLPAAFVAVQSHQYQILPLQLMVTVINSTGEIPFGPTLEMLLALVLFDILTEASIRMPKHVSLALSVVGAIVLGQTAVDAGFLSSLTVLVVAISGIGIYAVPDQTGVIGMFRMILVVAAGSFGIYGILLVSLAVFAYMSEMKTYDMPYLSPFAPIESGDLKNVFLKENLTDRTLRSYGQYLDNRTRLKNRREL